MSVREIGPYVLLHKLAEDALAETFRAGLKSGEDVERVVLLCFFKAGAEDVPWISETASVGRNALRGLESPHLADIVDEGELAGSAYLAYDYISGIGLSRLMQDSRREGVHVPLELSLLIADRMAKGLMAAWQHESRMLHGFLVPPLVQISSEGELRLLGFEVASRLRRLLKDERVKDELGSYLAPEVVPDGQPATTDDVYSLGAMLYELATGQVPPRDADELEQALQSPTLADGSGMPDEVRQFLVTCLAPPMRRTSLQGASEKLSEIVLSGRYDATSFNLAFFLHRLFGDELEEEETSDGAARTDTEEALASAALALEEESELADEMPEPALDYPTDVEPYEEEAASEVLFAESSLEPPDADATRRKTFGIAASIAAIALVAAGTWYFGSDGDDDATLASSRRGGLTDTGAASAPARPASTPSVDAAGETEPAGEAQSQPTQQLPEAKPATSRSAEPSQQDIEKRVEELAAKRAQSVEANLRDEYEQQIDELKAELEEAQRTPVPIEEVEPQSIIVANELDASSDAGPVDPGAAETETDLFASGAATQPLDEQDPASAASEADAPFEQPATEDLGMASGSVPEPLEPIETELASAQQNRPATPLETRPAPPRETARQPEPVAEVEPEEPAAVQRGDLVDPGPGVTPPKLTRSVQPTYPLMARRLNKQAVVSVRVLVDENGAVSQVEQLGQTAGYGFDEAAIKAAQKMEWEPATKNGVAVKMWWTVRLAFKP